MARPQWITPQRVEDIGQAKQLIPPILKDSKRDFRPPPTILSDFSRLLDHDVPNTNYTFELICDWFQAQKQGYTPIYIRGQQTPIDWKSKIGNSDMSNNFKTDYKVQIHKGDYVLRQDGQLFILSWQITNHPNNQATQSMKCNDYLTFKRKYEPLTDQFGYAIDDDTDVDQNGYCVVCSQVPASHSQYSGRPDYELLQGTVGLHPDHLITVYVQYNKVTDKIDINDQFVIGHSTYRAVLVYDGQIDISDNYGIIQILAKRVAGGGIDE